MGKVADGRSDMPMEMAFEIVMSLTSITVDTAGEHRLEPMEKNENTPLRRRCNVPATTWGLRDWRSRMECMAQQQACELAQQHKTGTLMAHMLERQTAPQGKQWRGMKLCLVEQRKCGTHTTRIINCRARA